MIYYTWSGVNWADLMAAQGAFGTNFHDRSTRTIVGTMLWREYRPVMKIGPKGAAQFNPLQASDRVYIRIGIHGKSVISVALITLSVVLTGVAWTEM